MNSRIVFVLLLSSFLFSCTKKGAKTQYADNLDFNYFSGKAKIDFDDGANQYNINANIRIKHDSIIWVSAYSSMFKIGKCLITQDSIFILKDIQGNEYYKYSFDSLATKIGYDLNFEIVESILMGNIPNIQGKTKINKQGNNQLITQEINELKVVSTVNTGSKKLTALDVAQEGTNNKISMKYDNFEEVNGKTFATSNEIKTKLQLKPEDFLDAIFKLKYVKPKFTDEKVSFPFVVGKRYEHKN